MYANHFRADSHKPQWLKRRNSTLLLREDKQRKIIEKTYHARYRVREEAEAYERLDHIINDLPHLRRPKIYLVDDVTNSLQLEFVEGVDLLHEYGQHGSYVLQAWHDTLTKLLVNAHRNNVRFDADPSNFIVEHSKDCLAVIDPVAVDLDLDHFPVVVFLFGLIKCFIRYPRWWLRGKLLTIWYRYYSSYVQNSGCAWADLNRQLDHYIATVIHWNYAESQSEPFYKRLIRILIIIPAWQLIRVPFKFNWVKTR